MTSVADPRAEALRPLLRTQRRGYVLDIWGSTHLAICVCAHDKVWPEGDDWERYGGAACEECEEASR